MLFCISTELDIVKYFEGSLPGASIQTMNHMKQKMVQAYNILLTNAMKQINFFHLDFICFDHR
jgi:hypothetical protein